MTTIHVWIEQLTRVHTHRETYTRHRGDTSIKLAHVTRVPALVHQLLGATPESSGATDGGGGAYGSRPAARIEALDTLIQIDDEASRWVRRLGENDPKDTARCLQLLHGLQASSTWCEKRKPERNDAGRVTCCDRHRIEADVRRWWHQARIITGWDTPAYRPFNTCPICDHRGGLRISLDLHTALCIECRTTWLPEEIGLLAEHIRTENLEDRDTPQAGAC